MQSHPFDTRDAAGVVHIFAGSPLMAQLLFWLAVLVTVGVVVPSARREKAAMARLEREAS